MTENKKKADVVPPGIVNAANTATHLAWAHRGKIITFLLTTLGAAAGAGYIAAKRVAKDAVDKVATKEYVDELAQKEAFQTAVAGVSGSPVGCVVAWPAEVPPPKGWEVCKGQEIAAKLEDAIYQVIGDTYGKAGNGKVKLPDFQGYFLRGLDVTGLIDDEGGRRIGRVQKEDLKKHEHSAYSMRKVAGGDGGHFFTVGYAASEDGVTEFKTSPSGGAETRPDNYAVHWIIRVR